MQARSSISYKLKFKGEHLAKLGWGGKKTDRKNTSIKGELGCLANCQLRKYTSNRLEVTMYYNDSDFFKNKI